MLGKTRMEACRTMVAIRSGLAVCGVLLLMIGTSSLALAEEGESILIRNVHLVSPGYVSDGVLVSLLVQDGKLRLVTREKVGTTKATIALDAENGYVLGKLSVGLPASFLILDSDPREDVNALLDTASHIRFAIIEGEIVKNDLPGLPTEEDEAKERRGWLAYTPPPMALPVSYGDETKWNRWETRWISGIFIGALVLDRMDWLDQDEASRQQVGDLQTFDGGEIRALRFGAVGTLNFKTPWVYTVFLTTKAFDRGFDTTNDDALTFFDYRLDIPLPKAVTLSLGKQKAPISMERLMPLVQLPMQERSIAADAMLAARDVGILVSGTGFKQRMTWAGGIFNDWFDAGVAYGDRATQGIGRVSALAFATPDDSHVLHIGLAGRYSNAKQGIQYARKPEFNRSPLFVDTGLLEAESAITWVGELAWRRGPLWIESEYTGSPLDSAPTGDPYFWGYHVAACWSISGEMRGYNRRTGAFKALPVARSVYQGGWGAWELSARWSEIDLNDKSVDGGRTGIASLGLTWWLSPTFSFGLNYRHIRLDRGGLVGHSDGLNARIFLSLE